QPAVVIYGTRDVVARNPRITEFVPEVDQVELDCGHWIMEERPAEVNREILRWLRRDAGARRPGPSSAAPRPPGTDRRGAEASPRGSARTPRPAPVPPG